MQKTRDYNNYDYLDATVKKNRLGELSAHYSALGWTCVDECDDKIYFDIKHIVLRRPHEIAHKDELQLLQIYLESAWNKIGEAEANPCPKTLAAGLFFGVISLALMVLGMLCGLQVLKFMPSVWGFVSFGFGAAVGVINAAVCCVFRKREINKTREEAAQAECVIEKVYADAAALTEDMPTVEALTGGAA